MKRELIISIWLLCFSTCAAAEQVGFRIVYFPKDHAVGRLKVRDESTEEDYYRGLISLPGWVFLDQAEGDVKVPTGKQLRLEVYEDTTDFSFLDGLEPNDLQVLILSRENIFDEDLIHLKGLHGLLGLNLGSTSIEGAGLVHLANLTSLEKLSLFNSQVSDAGLVHLSAVTSLKCLNLYVTQVKGPGLKHLKSLCSLVTLDLAMTPITDNSLAHVSELTWLKELQIYDTDISDKGLAHLKPLRSLEVLILGALRLDSSPITDEGLAHLKDLDSLKCLYLYRTGITDAGLAHLSDLTRLEVLYLKETQITGEGLAFLKNIPALKDLSLAQTNLDGKGLANCKAWSNTLEGLSLDKTKISDADLAHLSGLKALKYLSVSDTSITDAGLTHLQGLVFLKSIWLKGTKITDAGLVHLNKLNSLESIDLEKTQITNDGLMLLKDLPNLRSIRVMQTYVTNEGLERFKQNSASKSIAANIRRRLISTKEKGLTTVIVQSPQSEVKPPSLVGKSLPQLRDINIELNPEQTDDKIILVCFFNLEQRPSRHCIRELAKQAEQLKQKGITIVAAQVSKMDEEKLNDWVKKNNIPFSVGMIHGDEEKIRFSWGVRSLPWLILTDKQHIVTAEGFSLAELDEKLNSNSNR